MHCMCETFVHLILGSDIFPFLFSAIQYICVCKPFVTAKLKQMFHGSYHYRLQSGMEIYLGSQQTVPCMQIASNTLPAIRRCVYRTPHIANQVVVSINWSGDWKLQLQSGRSTKARLDNHPAGSYAELPKPFVLFFVDLARDAGQPQFQKHCEDFYLIPSLLMNLQYFDCDILI